MLSLLYLKNSVWSTRYVFFCAWGNVHGHVLKTHWHVDDKALFFKWRHPFTSHYADVIMSAMASQITSLTIVCSTVYSGADQRKHQNSGSLAFGRGIHRWPVNSPPEGPVTRKMFPFDDVIMPCENPHFLSGNQSKLCVYLRWNTHVNQPNVDLYLALVWIKAKSA